MAGDQQQLVITEGNKENANQPGSKIIGNDAASHFTSVTNQTGVTFKTSKTMQSIEYQITPDTDFLLLDLREPGEFEACRIREAVNFPARMISRDRFLPIILEFKNKPQALIIVYHNDEKKSLEPATVLYEKGYDNLFLLTGGLEKFIQPYHDLLVGSDVPLKRKNLKRKKVEL